MDKGEGTSCQNYQVEKDMTADFIMRAWWAWVAACEANEFDENFVLAFMRYPLIEPNVRRLIKDTHNKWLIQIFTKSLMLG